MANSLQQPLIKGTYTMNTSNSLQVNATHIGFFTDTFINNIQQLLLSLNHRKMYIDLEPNGTTRYSVESDLLSVYTIRLLATFGALPKDDFIKTAYSIIGQYDPSLYAAIAGEATAKKARLKNLRRLTMAYGRACLHNKNKITAKKAMIQARLDYIYFYK